MLSEQRLWDAKIDGLLLEVDIETPGRSFTPEGQIGQLINDAAARFVPKLEEVQRRQGLGNRKLVQLLLERITIPSLEDIQRVTQSSKLECLSDTSGKKNSRKEHNYISPFLQRSSDCEVMPVADDEVVLSVAVLRRDKEGGSKSRAQEFLVLGSQTLCLLKDVIYCLSNHTLGGQTRSSGYFLFENIFYNDMRNDNIDYSAYIFDWAQTNDIPLAYNNQPFQRRKMEETKFSDLSISIGVPYTFVHQGDCTHTLVFTEIRQFRPFDCKNQHAYPLQVFQSKIRRKKCQMCETFAARYVTYDDRLAPTNPCFFCDYCYIDFHYGSDGTILYQDFEVFPYYHS